MCGPQVRGKLGREIPENDAMRFSNFTQCVLALTAAMLISAPASAAPEPSIAPVSWTLDFTYEDPQRIIIPAVGESRPQVFWYMLYTVENNTGQDVAFYPRFDLLAGDTLTLLSEQDVPSNVFEAIKARHARTRPFLLSATQIIGPLKQSAGYARDGVAIWPDFDPTINEFSVFVRGLSGEIATVPNAGFDESRPEAEEVALSDGTVVPQVVNPRDFTLHKSLAVQYLLPGDPATRIEAAPVRQSQKWVMR
jgi:hypothetical protein